MAWINLLRPDNDIVRYDLPPGWWEIPLRDVFRLLDNYKGVLTMELRPRYRQYASEALAGLRALCANVPVDNI